MTPGAWKLMVALCSPQAVAEMTAVFENQRSVSNAVEDQTGAPRPTAKTEPQTRQFNPKHAFPSWAR
jgi:hypothetical protein